MTDQPAADTAVPGLELTEVRGDPSAPTALDQATATLQAWRAQGDHLAQPLQFAQLESLARRTAHQPAAVQALLQPRLDGLMDAYRQCLSGQAAQSDQGTALVAPAASASTVTARGPLGLLLDGLEGLHAPSAKAATADFPEPLGSPGADRSATQQGATGANAGQRVSGLHASTAPARRELSTLKRFRGTWSRLSAEQRLRQTLAQVPAQAGPLNSNHLVHRALVVMQEVSPDYLQRFVAHVEALLWLEQQQTPVMPNTARLEGRRKGAARGR